MSEAAPAVSARALRALGGRIDGQVLRPGTARYAKATTPQNSIARQEPAAVVAVVGAADIAAVVRWAGEVGLRVAVQARGHGAARPLGADTVLIDTSRLDRVEMAYEKGIVRAGAGATLAAVNATAARYGMVAALGSTPDVGVVGFPAYGGASWFTRPHGLAGAALLSANAIDGRGAPLRANIGHRLEVLWAYRGGGGVGIVTDVRMQVYPAENLWAGHLIWPLAQAEVVVPAWGAALRRLGRALTTGVALRRAPDDPALPPSLRGRPVVQLTVATLTGRRAMRELEVLLDRLPEPAVDTLAPCEPRALERIHPQPSGPVPTLGEGRWLTAAAGERALDILTAAGIDADDPLREIELRHVAARAPEAPGALTTAPGAVLLHAVGDVRSDAARAGVRGALDAVLAAARPVDTGRGAAAYLDGQDSAPDAFGPTAREQLRAIRRHVDPDGLIVPSRTLA